MTYYLALIHKEEVGGYGVSFPDVPGVVTVAETLDDAVRQAADVLAFAAEDWAEFTGQSFPAARSFEELKRAGFIENAAAGVVIAAIPFDERVPLAA